MIRFTRRRSVAGLPTRPILPGLLTTAALALGLTAGCMVEQDLTLNDDLSGQWRLEGRAMPFAGDALDDLAILGGYDDAGALYDEALANGRANLAARPDVGDAALERTGAHGWTGRVAFADLRILLGSPESGGMVALESRGNRRTLRLDYNRESARHLSELIPLMNEPALSLFNPAETEGIDEESYITGILGFTFGEENIPAIRRATVVTDLRLPGPVVAVEGGRQTGTNSVRYEIPFSRFIVPETPVLWTVTWIDDE